MSLILLIPIILQNRIHSFMRILNSFLVIFMRNWLQKNVTLKDFKKFLCSLNYRMSIFIGSVLLITTTLGPYTIIEWMFGVSLEIYLRNLYKAAIWHNKVESGVRNTTSLFFPNNFYSSCSSYNPTIRTYSL